MTTTVAVTVVLDAATMAMVTGVAPAVGTDTTTTGAAISSPS
jgi:hypothetical protein